MKRIITTITAVCVAFFSFAQGQTQVLTENFNGTTIPTDWTQNTLSTDGGWNAGSASALSSAYFPIPSTGSNIVATNDDDCNCNKSADWLITKPVDLSTYSSAHVTSKVYYLHAAYQGAQETAAFLYSLDHGSTWTTVQNITSSSSDWQDMYFDVSGAAGNDSVLFAFRYGDGGGWNYGMALDDFAVYIPYNYDFAATTLDLFPVQGLNNAPYTISGEVVNLGGQTVDDIDINYQIDGAGTVYTMSLTNLGLDPFDTYQFTHTTTWSPSATGTYDVEFWASDLDGATDQNASNDKLLTEIQIVPATEQRQVLVEEFTSSTCPPCASFNATFTPILNANSPNSANGKVNVVKYQMNWPSPGTDPNYNQDGLTRRTYYGVSGVPNPFMDANDGFSTQQQINNLYAIPALIDLSGSWTYNGTTAFVTVDVDPKANLTGDLKLRIAVVEEEVKVSDFPGYPVTNGESEFNYVMRKMLPNATGINLGNLTAGVSSNHQEQYSFTIGSVAQNNSNIWYTMDDLQVVAWIQDDSDKSILQSATLTAEGIGVNEFNDVARALKIYPNPANTIANLEMDLLQDANVEFTLVSATGQTAIALTSEMQAGANKLTIDLTDLSVGVYMMNVKIDGISTTKRIAITR